VSRLKLTRLAVQDLQEIGDYIANDNITAAHRFVQRLEQRCRSLAQRPGIGRKRDELTANPTVGRCVIAQGGDDIEVW